MKKTQSKLSEFLKSEKGIKIILAVGMIIIFLIFITTIVPAQKEQKKDDPVANLTLTTEDYAKQLEQKVVNIVSSISGVGEVNIMVTLESGIENVYAQEEKQNKDKTEDVGASANTTIQQRDNLETKTIIIQDENGNRQALLKTQIEPVVKGVVVVCDGGDDIIVEDSVTRAITTALKIKSTQVCVIKKSK